MAYKKKEVDPNTVARAFELPLQKPDRPEVWSLIRDCWREATWLANWCVLELARNDVTRTPELKRLPKMPDFENNKLHGLYGRASEQLGLAKPGSWWAYACTSASTICRDVERKYRSKRLEVIWKREQALSTYRYPYPWPVHSQAWKAAFLDDTGRPHITINLPGGPATLRLDCGPDYRRQMVLFRQVVNGNLPRMQIVLRQHKVLGSNPRHPVAPGRSRVMVKMVARLPIREKTGDKVLTLFNDRDAFWIASISGRREDRAWTANYDHVRRLYQWLEIHEARRQRLAQDAKMESRVGAARRRQWQASLDRACEKQHRRLTSWLHEMTAHIVGYCRRQCIGEVVYDESDRFSDAFPWHRLNLMLNEKLKESGITIHRCGLEESDESPDGIQAEEMSTP